MGYYIANDYVTRGGYGDRCYTESWAKTFIGEFARAKRRSANLTSEVDENRVTLMDDPRLSNYFASTRGFGQKPLWIESEDGAGDKLRAVDGG